MTDHVEILLRSPDGSVKILKERIKEAGKLLFKRNSAVDVEVKVPYLCDGGEEFAIVRWEVNTADEAIRIWTHTDRYSDGADRSPVWSRTQNIYPTPNTDAATIEVVMNVLLLRLDLLERGFVKGEISASNFAMERHTPESEFSHYGGSWSALCEFIASELRKPTTLDVEKRTVTALRSDCAIVKVNMGIGAVGFFARPYVRLDALSDIREKGDSRLGAPRVRMIQRMQGELPTAQIEIPYYGLGTCKPRATKAEVILYRADALLENDGERSSNAEWEIVSINATSDVYPCDPVPMSLSTMARNYAAAGDPKLDKKLIELWKVGGTPNTYTAGQFAESAMFFLTHGIIVKSG